MANKEMIEITILATVVFCLVILGIMLFIVYMFNKKRFLEKSNYELELKNIELEKTNAVIQAQEQERSKIARNLHDEVGAVLTMASRNLKSFLKEIPEKQKNREDLLFTMEILEQTVEKIRSISHGMLPHFLVKFGLQKTLQRLMNQTEKTLGHSCTFTSGITKELQLEQQHEIHFYSIVLELLNNLMKHSHPKSIHINLELNSTHLLLKMRHDGVAISQSEYEYLLINGDGMGLESIDLRLRMINGELLYQRNTPGGTIELSMPMNESTLSNEKINLQEV
jgi:signal transduction histidine kinase